MQMKELVARFDEEYEYPLERLLEKYLPAVDRFLDWVFATVFVVEQFFIDDDELDEHDGLGKEETATTLITWVVSLIPLPPMLRTFLAPVLTASLPSLIKAIVAFLNRTIGNDDLEPEQRRKFTALLPGADWKPEKLAAEWLATTAAALGGDES